MNVLSPYNDELLSSLIFRISRANYTSVSNITKYIFKTKGLQLKDLDLYNFSKNELSFIKNTLRIRDITNYQLLKYTGYLEEQINFDGRKRWITHLYNKKKDLKFYGTRFCPHCFKEYSYLKKQWRLLIVNICQEHNCFLLNSCPKCNKNLKYPNSHYEQKIYDCYYCGFDLRNSKTDLLKINSLELKYQDKLLNILDKGYYKLNNRYYYSIGLFYLLKILIKNIMRVKKTSTYYIEELSPKELSYFLTYSLIILNKFPHRLNRFYKKNNISNKHKIFDKYRYKIDNIPCWFLSHIHYNTISTRWYF